MDTASDIRYEIFRNSLGKRVIGVLISEKVGVLSGLKRTSVSMTSLDLALVSGLCDGCRVHKGQEIARITGNPVQIARAEERIIGAVSKFSGIATAAFHAREKAGPDCQVVSGGWKKMPMEIKDAIRQAAVDGGIDVRISREPFVYLDKNYVRILGGIEKAIETVLPLKKSVAIQVRGETDRIADEAVKAVRTGAKIIMVDTGRREDLENVIRALEEKELRRHVRVAFAGNIALAELNRISRLGMDIVDIGYAILDAPSLPMRFDVINVN